MTYKALPQIVTTFLESYIS